MALYGLDRAKRGVERKEKLIKHIREAFDKQPKLFTVITNDEPEHLICDDEGSMIK